MDQRSSTTKGNGRMPPHAPLRLFVALDLDPSAIEHLEAFLLARRVDSQSRADGVDSQSRTDGSADAQLRWIPAKRWHVTLAFLGAVDRSRVPRIERQIERCTRGIRAEPVSFGGAGRFRHAVYVELRAGDWLTELADGLRLRLSADQDFDFVGHVTVARARGKGRPAVPDWLPEYTGPQFRPAAIHLMSSTLGPVPKYRRLRTWQLAD